MIDVEDARREIEDLRIIFKDLEDLARKHTTGHNSLAILMSAMVNVGVRGLRTANDSARMDSASSLRHLLAEISEIWEHGDAKPNPS